MYCAPLFPAAVKDFAYPRAHLEASISQAPILSEELVGVESATMHSLLDYPDSICIVRECRELEPSFRTQFTDQLLAEADNVSVRGIKNQLLEIDKEIMLATCDTKAPLIADVCKCSGAWPAVWDSARHLGSRHTLGLQSLTRLLAHHGRGSSPCPKSPTVNSASFPTVLLCSSYCYFSMK